MSINVGAFFDNLIYMGKGMLGIFIALGLIVVVTMLLNKFTK